MDLIHSELTANLFHVVLILQLSLDLYYTEDEIYELSYTKEPKNPKIQVSPTHQTLSSCRYSLVSHKGRRSCALLSVGVTSSKQTLTLGAE